MQLKRLGRRGLSKNRSAYRPLPATPARAATKHPGFRIVARTFSILTVAVLAMWLLGVADVRAAYLGLSLGFGETWDSAGNAEFSFTAYGSPNPAAFTPILRAPDGSVVATDVTLNHLSFADIQSRFFGTWTIQDGAATPNYSFTFSSFSLDDVFHERPIVTAPVNGSIKPTDFPLTWHYASGAVPVGTPNFIFEGSGDVFLSHYQPDQKELQWIVDDNLIDQTTHLLLAQDVVTLGVGVTTRIDSHFGPITLIGAPGPDTFSPGVVAFQTISAPIVVTVVPEPSAIVLVASACALVFASQIARRPLKSFLARLRSPSESFAARRW